MTQRALVLGSCIFDTEIEVEHLPAQGETVFSTSVSDYLGGKGFNQASVLAALGDYVTLLSCVGNDFRGKQFLQAAADRKIDTRYVIQSENADTGQGFPIIDDTNMKSFIVNLGASASYPKESAIEALNDIGELAFILAQLETSTAALDVVKEYSSKNNVPFILNAAPVVPAKLHSVYDTQYLLVNSREFEWLVAACDGASSQMEDKMKLVMKEFRCKAVVVTRGELGACAYDGNLVTHLASVAKKVVDPLGAGDAFAAGFASAIGERRPLTEAIQNGLAVAARACAQKGGGII